MSLIALDWGTSSLRAWRLGPVGAVVEERSAPLGILKVPDGDFDGVFARISEGWLGEGSAAIASGMIGSRQGWVEAPYLECPAGETELAARLIPIRTRAGAVLHLVPGISRTDADGVPDVMRGEETQIVGDAPAEGRRLYLLPGTHSKWALVEDGRVVWFATFMTGELFAVLSEHSILGRLMEGRAHDEDAFARGLGYATASRHRGLLRRLFSARTLGLFHAIPPAALAAYLSGLLIGSEIAEATEGLAAVLDGPLPPVVIIGGADLAARYGAALDEAGIDNQPTPPDTTAAGLYRIARRAGLVAS